MSNPVEDLRRKVARSLGLSGGMDENPLEVVGLTESILDLGLTDEELFETCRGIARAFLVHFHEDRRRDARSRELQLKFSRAFTALKDRRVFGFALSEFRQHRSAARTETNRLQRDVRRLQADLEEREAKLYGVTRDLSGRLESVQAEASRTIRTQLQQIESLRASRDQAQKAGHETALRVARYLDRLSAMTGEEGPRVVLTAQVRRVTVLAFSPVGSANGKGIFERRFDRAGFRAAESSGMPVQIMVRRLKSLLRAQGFAGELRTEVRELVIRAGRVIAQGYVKRTYKPRDFSSYHLLGSVPLEEMRDVPPSRDAGFHPPFEHLLRGLSPQLTEESLLALLTERRNVEVGGVPVPRLGYILLRVRQ